MTFDQAKKKLKSMTAQQMDMYGVELAKLHSKIDKKNNFAAEALELAAMALMLYTKGGK